VNLKRELVEKWLTKLLRHLIATVTNLRHHLGDVFGEGNYLDCLCSVQAFTLPSSLFFDVA
jgi:hypothetical protein